VLRKPAETSVHNNACAASCIQLAQAMSTEASLPGIDLSP